MNKEPYVVVFSGVPGTSKSSNADHHSLVFEKGNQRSDGIRFEVKEDLRVSSLSIREDLNFANINQNGALEEFERRLSQRRQMVLSLGKSAIFDGSVDRRWAETKQELQDYGYNWFLINLELSRSFLENLYRGTGRESFIPQLDSYIKDHAKFVEQYDQDISFEITDKNFLNRLELAVDGLKAFLGM
jgi:hypothetical protein